MNSFKVWSEDDAKFICASRNVAFAYIHKIHNVNQKMLLFSFLNSNVCVL